MKLVRDSINQYVFNLRGEHLNTRIADESELKDLFKRKVMEEASEVMQAESQSHLEEELADLLEVIDGFIDSHDMREAVMRKKEAKKSERGGFTRGLVLEDECP